MRFITFRPAPDQEPRAGLIVGSAAVDAGMALHGRPASVIEFLEAGSLQEAGEAAARVANGQSPLDGGPVLPLQAVLLEAPVRRPSSLRDFYAFEAHVRQARARRGLEMVPEWYEFPAFYFSNPSAIFGPDAAVPYPAGCTALDYELELACVIGKGGMDIPEEEAEEHIAGYTVMNDWSARDIQQKEMKVGLGPAKAKDFATSLGPWLVTPDELHGRLAGPGRYDLRMEARVNGKTYSQGNFKTVHWTFPQMIAWASRNAALHPGDVLGSGTVGTGCIAELGAETHGWLRPGDRVELEIEGLGRLANTVGPERARHGPLGALGRARAAR